MFRALPMTRVTIWFLASEAPDAALLLARHGNFGPAQEGGEEFHRAFPETPAERYREVFQEAEARLLKILEHCGGPMPEVPADAVAPSLHELEEINDWLRHLWHACSSVNENEQRILEEQKRLAALQETFSRLEGLNLDLSRLFRPQALLDARLGQVPAANVRRLKDALQLAGYVLSVFDQAEGQSFAVVAGPRRAGDEIGGLLAQAGWRELPVPKELQTHPEQARNFLAAEAKRLEAEYDAHCRLMGENISRFSERIREIRVQLALARPLAEASMQGVRGRRHLAVFTGWVPKRDLKALHADLEARFHGRYLMSSRAPAPEDAGHIPSLLVYPSWIKPFVPLVKSYGVPRYGEFDPSLLFAVTYVFLFGAMFGDVGHGAVIMALAFLLGGKLYWLRVVGMCAGASSVLFGFLYGSIFGYEEILHPLWQSPLHDAGEMLVLAVYGGVGFICATLLINTYNRLNAGHIAQALFDSAGLAGLVFYLAMVFGLRAVFIGEAFGTASAVAALLGIGIIAAFKWLESPAGLGERLLVTFIETLETGINLFANTLSFLRVAAFSLNHVALALAVFTLARGMDGAGQWATVVLGNVVIIVLEGGIVAIQALRLMYYEGFSRFFGGDGVEFTPLRLKPESGQG